MRLATVNDVVQCPNGMVGTVAEVRDGQVALVTLGDKTERLEFLKKLTVIPEFSPTVDSWINSPSLGRGKVLEIISPLLIKAEFEAKGRSSKRLTSVVSTRGLWAIPNPERRA